MLEHGGKLIEASHKYGIPLEQWLDLSTGINPLPYPIQLIPPANWHRLPEEEDGLQKAAELYYGTEFFIPVAGSQTAIKLIPKLRAKSIIGILSPSYTEHAQAWSEAGHEIVFITAPQQEKTAETITKYINELDVLIVCNPNNPTGQEFSRSQLLEWRQILAAKGGWLIVDEAFMDANPENSLIDLSGTPGLLILRSLGKFFGLAGARVGFFFAADELLKSMRLQMGPWAIAGPSRFIATQALSDHQWQQKARLELNTSTKRLATLLAAYKIQGAGSTAYFQWIQHPECANLHQFFAKKGILTRLFQEPESLRIGLPGKNEEWRRLEESLVQWSETL